MDTLTAINTLKAAGDYLGAYNLHQKAATEALLRKQSGGDVDGAAVSAWWWAFGLPQIGCRGGSCEAARAEIEATFPKAPRHDISGMTGDSYIAECIDEGTW